ncbi:zinc finger BED domain-containing protein 5-like [Metopolophium dirhodum]|uniref:zinc finger BED domain-containing protein 5-like n=1 Tax=Metopolophium dirhodum TaxID=44670 RepID=UPI00298FACD4|nr:zinc finger BED domain-containing protein 5-like [Metopolophium dirhodum]
MDQWLKTGAIKKLDQVGENIHLTSISQDLAKDLVTYRKYTVFRDFDYPKPKCIVCGEVLANSCMKPSLLLRHLETKHADCKNKECDFFKRLARSNENTSISTSYIKPANKDNQNAIKASYRIAQCVYVWRREHKKINSIPLSNNTISCRIQDMPEDIELTVIDRIKNSKIFAIQVDESSDVTNFAVLLVIARLCTDGGKSMSGIYSGLRGRVMKIVPNINWSHCCIHRQSLVSKNLPGEQKLVLDEAVKLVNFIKARSTNLRIFKALCEDMMSPYSSLLLHTEVRKQLDFNEEFFQKATSLSIVEKENLIELPCDTTLKSDFKRKQLINFWVDIRNEYERLSD